MCFVAAGKEESGNKTTKQPLHSRPTRSQERSIKLQYNVSVNTEPDNNKPYHKVAEPNVSKPARVQSR